jgi:hypothetical protein
MREGIRMTSRALTFATGLFIAGLVGSAVAAVPDASPFTWSAPLPVAARIELPDAPPPPGRATARPFVRADILLATEPRVSAPCPDHAKRLLQAASQKSARSSSQVL